MPLLQKASHQQKLQLQLQLIQLQLHLELLQEKKTSTISTTTPTALMKGQQKLHQQRIPQPQKCLQQTRQLQRATWSPLQIHQVRGKGVGEEVEEGGRPEHLSRIM